MKNKDQKYNEAVERNMWNAERNKRMGRSNYQGVGLTSVRLDIGVRNNDSRYEARIRELVKGTPNE